MALREFWTLTPSQRGDHRALFLSFFVVLPVQYLLLADDWYGLFSIFIPVYAFLALPAISTLAGDTANFLARSAKVQWGLMLGVYAISHAPGLYLLDTGDAAGPSPGLSRPGRPAQRRVPICLRQAHRTAPLLAHASARRRRSRDWSAAALSAIVVGDACCMA